MDTVILDNKTVPRAFQMLQKDFLGETTYEQNSYTLILSREIGHGHIRYTKLERGLSVLDFDCTLYRDTVVSMAIFDPNSLAFLYVRGGNCSHHFYEEEPIYLLPFQSVAIYSREHASSVLTIKQDAHFTFNVIIADKAAYFDPLAKEGDSHFVEKFTLLLEQLERQPTYVKLGLFNHDISELLERGENDSTASNSISKSLTNSGKYYTALAKHLELFCNEMAVSRNSSGLLKQELQKISDLGLLIKQNPEIQHTIKSLCSTSGLAPAKLQGGFKFIFDRTVSDYIRNVRLQKAQHLITSTDLSISEIVYTIGLTSRSYFCKIFKRKYKCTPKQYKLRHL